MTSEELIQLLAESINDETYTSDDLLTWINRVILEIAGGIYLPGENVVSPPLPDLFEMSTVMTDLNFPYVGLPANYHRQLHQVFDEDEREIDLYGSFIAFSSDFPLFNKKGRQVQAACVKGPYLYYQPLPYKEVELTLHYYRRPVLLEDDDDIPDGIPEHLHDRLIVNRAAQRIFERIENGIDGDKVNTTYYRELFYAALRDLDAFVPYDGDSLYLMEFDNE